MIDYIWIEDTHALSEQEVVVKTTYVPTMYILCESIIILRGASWLLSKIK